MFDDRFPEDADLNIVEAIYGDSKPILHHSKRTAVTAVLWQKEKMLNRLIKKNWDYFDGIFWVDCDVIPLGDDFVDQCGKALLENDVAQGFKHGYRLTKAETAVMELSSGTAKLDGCAYSGLADDSDKGLIWGARTDWLKEVGGGDYFLIEALKGNVVAINEAMGETHARYVSRVANTKPKVGYVDGEVAHLYHGEEGNRRYETRYDIAVRHDFDPFIDLKESPSGDSWEWATRRPEFHREVYDYFMGRKEDS